MSNVSYASTGRRKNAVARIKIFDGNGKIVINNKAIDEYFGGLERLKKVALKPFDFWNGRGNYNFYVNVKGGGISGQAGAISHSLARTILKLDEPSRAALKREGFLSRDSRMVERKKAGRPKARKRFQFSKR
ncbi:30S ribosomal protein S9 [Endomicrobiia bacterium]|uniref:30S ribosomal protein S9 n=1 Tax=Endomicrobium trichonymphae TaxID=1408204 RepID=UPI00221AF436|nr:30S ribosomal protein S9 [Endomicrobiia bacterium]GMO51022.1 MAG: 30S ribosomal protein S9 [Candidatus Endomicrobium trichonymphae]GHT16329.1 30S ribosomal protein S9 [Endomicrobiia bacterium]GHT20647.1 30S ribosomal protein S9 [Endomicrobiia bacterium]GHT23941.1 30S ribosomal protein S9 [Endomicrobiia bacterium]